MERFSEFFVRHRPTIAAAVVLLTVLSAFGVRRIVIDDEPRAFFSSGDADFARLEEVFRDFGSDDNDCIVVLEGEGFFTPEAADVLRALDDRIGAIEGVESTFSLLDVLVFEGGPLPAPLMPARGAGAAAFERAGARAFAHPLVAGRILARDGRTALLVARLAGDSLPIGTLRPVVDAVRAAVSEVAADGPVRARLTGVPPIRAVIFDTLGHEQRLFTLLGSLLGFVVGFLIFHRPGPVLITSGASVLAGLWALAGMGFAGESLNLLNSSLPMLIMVIALTDAVHIMMDVLHSRSAGVPPVTAGRDAIRRLGLACFLTSVSTAVGFGSLAVSDVSVIRRFGIAFACAVIFTFVSVLLTVPLFSSVVLRSRARSGFTPRWSGLRRPAERFIRAVVGRARIVATVGVAATFGLLLLALRLTPDNRLTEATPGGNEEVAALARCEEAFGGVLQAGVLCEWPAGLPTDAPEVFAVLREVTGVLAAHPFTHAPLSVLDLLSLLPGDGAPRLSESALALLPEALTRRLLRADLRQALVTARIPDAGAETVEPAYAEIEARLEEVRERHPGFALNLTGTGYVARKNINVMIDDFATGLLLAAVVIVGVISFAFRSVRLGLLSVIPNAFPLVLTAAALAVTGKDLQVVSAIAFTVCLGLAVDDTVHFIARYRRELEENGDVQEAVVRAFLHVGAALLITTAILLAGFAILFLSTIPTTRLFAALCSFGMLAALLGDLVFLPALVVVLARKPAPTRA